MAYRLVVLVFAILLVVALFGLIWWLCRLFLSHHGEVKNLNEKTQVLATWTFAGVAVGLVFVVLGAFVLGPWAFYRTVASHDVAVDDAAAVLWGFGIVLASLVISAGGLLILFNAVGAL
ncbi:hypothetical protein C8D92_101223 [Tamilnaduibacter salinus]|uniref:Uncharacterized protein n=1 Tax=Tamilnaduibacter salinus TaxID=1484056 RepID=A0A2A2I7X9_9GAMM|nr:hypothetical protein [Tamilnaduibacter salinus]PAV27153.1 hypothetical protein CF392_01475 [Tamilnaduibacter salinus]PVY79017.1 hypothetical protein C8D92_101223 [Tamilnaduibacter salinus]